MGRGAGTQGPSEVEGFEQSRWDLAPDSLLGVTADPGQWLCMSHR